MSERGNYRSIPNALFSGPDFRRLSERARWIFVVLKMNVGPVGIDVWYPEELAVRLVQESGANIDQVRLTLDILEHENWIRREDNIIWVVGHLDHDPHFNAANSKHRLSVLRHVAGLPRIGIVRDFISAHPAWILADEARTNNMGWAFDRVSNGKRRPIRRVRNGYAMGIGTHSIQEEDKEEDKEEETSASRSADADQWPATWAYDTSQRFLSNGVVIGPKLVGNHAKPAKALVPWDEWLRVVDRMATSSECGYGLPALLRSLPKYRDDAQLDPNRELTLEEAMAV